MKANRILQILSLICAVGMFPMTSVFQSMAYWGDDFTFYWLGVGITYSFFLLGLVLLIVSHLRTYRMTFLSLATFKLLICGFLWTTFIILAGMSGV